MDKGAAVAGHAQSIAKTNAATPGEAGAREWPTPGSGGPPPILGSPIPPLPLG